MPKRMNDTEARKKMILDAAEDLFLKKGYPGVNLDDIAAAVGVVRGTVLHYFRTKEILYRAVLDRRGENSTNLIIALMYNREQSIPDILRTVIYFCQKQFKDSKSATDACFEDSSMRFQYDSPRLGTYYRLLDGLEQLIERGNEEGTLRIVNPRARASTILFGIFGVTGESMSTIEVTAELYELMEKMLGISLREK